MLQEPQQRIAEHVVVLVVDTPGSGHEAYVDPVSLKRRPERLASRCLPSYAVPLAHGPGDPCKLSNLREGVEGGDHATAATAHLLPAIRSVLVFYRATIAGENELALTQYSGVKLGDLGPVGRRDFHYSPPPPPRLSSLTSTTPVCPNTSPEAGSLWFLLPFRPLFLAMRRPTTLARWPQAARNRRQCRCASRCPRCTAR